MYIAAGFVLAILAGLYMVHHQRGVIRQLQDAAVATDVALRACQARNLNIKEDQKSDAEVDSTDGLLDAAREWVR